MSRSGIMTRLVVTAWTSAMLLTGPSVGADWPTFRQNNRRNAVASESLDTGAVRNMRLEWKWLSPEPPHPAWYGPAKWDAYAELRGLKSMRNYDTVYHVIAADEHVYFSSSSDDSIHCIYADAGRTKWLFTTDAPVRVPPTYWDGKIYAGADDGFIYCLDAVDGTLLWKYCPSPPHRRILHDGRLISLWPCRSGVTVDQGVAYFTASLLPWNPGYLCAVDANTGKIENDRHFVRPIANTTMEAPLALSATHVIVPRGRVAPALFSRADGSPDGSLKGGGGSFVVLSGKQVFHGPGNKAGWITGSNLQTRDVVATLQQAKAMVIDGSQSFMLTAQELVSSDFVAKQVRWRLPTDCTHALIKTGDVLILGGAGKVCAVDAEEGTLIWEHAVDGVTYGLAIADGRLFASTDKGTLFAFSPDTTGDRESEPAGPAGGTRQNTATPAASESTPFPAPASQTDRDDDLSSPADTYQVAVGPWLQFQQPDTATVSWRTRDPSTGWVELQRGGQLERIPVGTRTTEHTIRLEGLPHRSSFRYRVVSQRDGLPRPTRWYEVDTLFNYTHRPPVRPLSPATGVAVASDVSAAPLVGRLPARRGICVFLGLTDGALAHQVILQSQARVIAFATDADLVARLRRTFMDAGLYGSRFACHQVEDLADIPAVGDFANVVVSGMPSPHGVGPRVASEALRITRPGGVVIFAASDVEATQRLVRSALPNAEIDAMPAADPQAQWVIAQKPSISGAGQWTHAYGNSANALYDGEQLGEAARADEFRVQWLGRPGPRFQPDRNGRKPPPLSASGRLFVQGLQRIAAVDQYNGSVLWSLEIPDLGRFNMPRDCGNWCADPRRVYVAIRDRCWVVDAAAGDVKHHFSLPGEGISTNRHRDWGYVAVTGELLIGSAVRQGSSWSSFWGKSGWYDAERGKETQKVCSDELFALDANSGEPRWRYQAGVVINSTITVTGEHAYFLECRNPAVVSHASRRIGGDGLWQQLYLVALNVRTGEKTAERELSISAGQVACYLAHSDETLVLVSSANKKYYVYAFAAEDCQPIWKTSFAWGKGKADHGSHLSRPAIVGDKLFVRPLVLKLSDGERLPMSIPVGGCGTYAATARALFFRAGSGKNSAVWNSDSGDYTSWSRLRPDCWLSTIVAGGMLLSPEGGGGCSCGSWLETSIGFMPLSRSKSASLILGKTN